MKIAIVNDSMVCVEAMRRAVLAVPGYEVAWIAHNGAEAVANCTASRPEIILMDLLMPVMDGVEATRRIMAQSPCSILVVTATVSGNISEVFNAMSYGALDAVCTPELGPNGESVGAERFLAKIKMIGVLQKPPANPVFASLPMEPQRGGRGALLPLVAIGASTGGPQALAEVLSKLPADFKPAVVIVQHVDALFAPGLASWLEGQCKLRVNVVTPGCKAEGGQVWLACTNDHLVLNSDLTMDYTPHPREYAYRPSVDVFFESVSRYWPGIHTAVLLTGMGSDGARGLLSLRQKKWNTIAQDEKSCVVYGMPKAAAELHAAAEVLPLKDIAARIVQLAQRRGSTQRLGIRP